MHLEGEQKLNGRKGDRNEKGARKGREKFCRGKGKRGEENEIKHGKERSKTMGKKRNKKGVRKRKGKREG